MPAEIGACERARDLPAHDLAVCAATGPWREPAHDLPEITRVGGAGRRDALVDERIDLRVRQRLGQVLAQDGDLGLLLLGEVGAATLLVGLDGFAARLDLAG